MLRFGVSVITIVIVLAGMNAAAADSNEAFNFESIHTLEEMNTFVRDRFPLGSMRDELRRVFVNEGRATIKTHPKESGVEKYLYDINLCRYYVWRWNISADFDADGKMKQAYVNGKGVFQNGAPQKIVPKTAEAGKKAAIVRVQRPRPEADKGEASLGYILFDRDSDPRTTDDQAIAGAGPSRADPVNMGKLITYTEVDPWRSIFDSDNADRIVPYQGDCIAADRKYQAKVERK